MGKLIEALEAIEKFHFSFTAVTSSRSSGGISGMYSSFGRKLFESPDSNKASQEIREFIDKLRQRKPKLTEFVANFGNIIYTKNHTKQRGLIRYSLLRLQEDEHLPHLGSDDDLSIEHLYPQSGINPNFPDEVVGQFGNLLLVDSETNGLLKDKPFLDKKKVLTDRGYVLPGLLIEADSLTPELIGELTTRRAEIAYNRVWAF